MGSDSHIPYQGGAMAWVPWRCASTASKMLTVSPPFSKPPRQEKDGLLTTSETRSRVARGSVFGKVSLGHLVVLPFWIKALLVVAGRLASTGASANEHSALSSRHVSFVLLVLAGTAALRLLVSTRGANAWASTGWTSFAATAGHAHATHAPFVAHAWRRGSRSAGHQATGRP